MLSKQTNKQKVLSLDLLGEAWQLSGVRRRSETRLRITPLPDTGGNSQGSGRRSASEPGAQRPAGLAFSHHDSEKRWRHGSGV